MKRVLIAVVLGTFSLPAQALTIYQYTGNLYELISDATSPPGSFDTTMRVTGFFSLAVPLTPDNDGDITERIVDYSFQDGRSTYEMNNSDITVQMLLDDAGDFSTWYVSGQTNSQLTSGDYFGSYMISGQSVSGRDQANLYVCAIPKPTGGCQNVQNGQVDAAAAPPLRGTWSIVTTVPIPAAFWLFGSALGLLGWMRR